MLWRRLDRPGHDACRLERSAAGWTLEGAAVFSEASGPARLSYHLACDLTWRTEWGEVHGWIGAQSIELKVVRGGRGVWTLNGAAVPSLDRCVDLDLGFTPSTNLFQLRRLALDEGQAMDNPVAWLDVSTATLTLLEQRYERRSETAYWYEAPRFTYAALIEVMPIGFVRRYPQLWEAEL